MNNLAQLYLQEDRCEEAVPLIESCLEKRRKLLGEDHRDTLTSWNDWAMILYQLKEGMGILQLTHTIMKSNHPTVI